MLNFQRSFVAIFALNSRRTEIVRDNIIVSVHVLHSWFARSSLSTNDSNRDFSSIRSTSVGIIRQDVKDQMLTMSLSSSSTQSGCIVPFFYCLCLCGLSSSRNTFSCMRVFSHLSGSLFLFYYSRVTSGYD